MGKRDSASSVKTPPVDRKKRPRASRLRARADAAIINQWLSEQTVPAKAPATLA